MLVGMSLTIVLAVRVPEHDSISVPPLDPRCCRPLATRGSGRILAAAAACALIAAACTGGDDSSDAAADSDAPTIVATTNIWADVVENVTCNGLVHVESLMPPGADPHTFEPSLRDRADMANASLVVANGLGLEESLEDTLDAVAADGTPVFSIGDHLEPITIGEASSGDGHDEDGHDESDHDEDEHDEHGHDESDHDDDGHDEDGHDRTRRTTKTDTTSQTMMTMIMTKTGTAMSTATITRAVPIRTSGSTRFESQTPSMNSPMRSPRRPVLARRKSKPAPRNIARHSMTPTT